MTTQKKKHLIELMIEAGVKWPDGAEYAAQDKDGWVSFYTHKPYREDGDVTWSSNGCCATDSMKDLDSLCRNWHQTIVTLEQYAEAVAAAAMTPAAQQETQQSPKYCASVMRQMPDNTIEQLTSDYYAKAAEADRLQSVADEALKAADDALLALEKAGELLGLVISIDTKPKPVEQPAQPEITDWRDLRVGDVIECIEPNGGGISTGDDGVITSIESGYLLADFIKQKDYIYDKCQFGCEFKFIRRP